MTGKKHTPEEIVAQLRQALPISKCRACAAPGQHRSTQRNVQRGREDEVQLTGGIIALVRKHGRLGGQPQAGGAGLAAGGPEGPAPAAET